MNRSITSLAVLSLSLALLLGACKGNENGSGETTETIAPAAAKPGEMGTDALTQTVDIGDGRTDAEGGTQTGTLDPTYLGSDGATTMTAAATDGSPVPPTATTGTR